MTRRALVVRGGWEGHSPVECTEKLLPWLREQFDDVTVSETLDAYLDPSLGELSLIVQCWSDGGDDPGMTGEQSAGLLAAVRGGVGFGGWHGGIVATMRNSWNYQFMVGGQFVQHPGDFIDYTVAVTSDHEIVAGLPSSFDVHTEQYYLHMDPAVDVHATTTFDGGYGEPQTAGQVMPVVWTKTWGEGRVFVCTLGHFPHELDEQPARTIIERGLLWAAR